MTVLDKIKSFFKREKPVVRVAEEEPPEATIEKPVKTTRPRKKAPRAARKRAQVRRQRRAG